MKNIKNNGLAKVNYSDMPIFGEFTFSLSPI